MSECLVASQTEFDYQYEDKIQAKQFELGLQKQEEKKKAKDARDNIIHFYHDHEQICKKAYDYYKELDNQKEQYVDLNRCVISEEDFKDLLCPVIILVLTANPIEEAVFLHWLYDQTAKPIKGYMVNTLCLTIAQTDNNQTIVHANTQKTGEKETRIVLNKICKVIQPTYCFMLGICYGLDMGKYSIGSVLISDSISSFRLNFRDELDSDETIFEAEDEYDEKPDSDLVRTLRQFFAYISVRSILSDDANPTTAQSAMGKFLSSNSLMSSKRVKQAVMKQYSSRKPKPLGGEMEGAGMLQSYLVEEKGFSNWIIMKSICDWVEKKNALDPVDSRNQLIKDSIQAFAMTNTCGAFSSIMRLLV